MAADTVQSDERILALYREQSEEAIEATLDKYGGLLFQLAFNILENREDAEECVNDVCFSAWKTAGEVQPIFLRAWLCRIVRNAALDRVKRENRQKRGGGKVSLLLDELEFCLVSEDDVERAIERGDLSQAISGYLRGQPNGRRKIFLQRYYFASSLRAIAGEHGMTENAVKALLFRMRAELKTYLQEGGFGHDEW